MKKFKALYRAMHDDLKDAEMMIDYAYSIRKKNPEDKTLADELAKYASFRLNHFMEFHKHFADEAMKTPEFKGETVALCMWDETHEMMQEWYRQIKDKVEKY